MQGELSNNPGLAYFPPDSGKPPPRGGANDAGREVPEGATDSTSSPKFVRIKEKKLQNRKLVEYAKKTVTLKALDIATEEGEVPMGPHMTDKTAERIGSCSTWMRLATPEDYSRFKKVRGYTCRNAFCPVCAAYQSRRDGLKLSVMMDGIQDLKNVDAAKSYGGDVAALPFIRNASEKGAEFLMLTLTTPNVKGDRLKEEEKKYAKVFNRMMDHWFAQVYSEYYLGYVRKLEVTYNRQKVITKEMWEGTGKYNSPWKWKFRHMGLKVGDRNPYYDTYNPHYHVIVAVTPDFFGIAGDGSETMALSRERLLAKWRELMGDPSITQVKIQKVYKVRGEGGTATAEVSKYVAKDTDMLYSPKVFKVFYESLKGVKRMTFGGIFREFHRLFAEDKLDKYLPVDETAYKWLIDYAWGGFRYTESKRRELTPEEAYKLAGMKYSEANDTDDF